MSVWFDGSNEIACDIQRVKDAINDHGAHYVAVVTAMPGMTSVQLVDQGSDFATIRTNEGLMKRSSIVKRIDADRVTVELDEEYQAGRKIMVRSHILDDYTLGPVGVTHRIVISDVEAPGLLGFFYRHFGKSRTGRAFLNASKAYLEKQ